MPHFDTNLPSDYGWGPPSRGGEHIVPFTYQNHSFYNGVRAEAANWFTHLCDLVVPMIPGGLFTAHGAPSPDDGDWGWEFRANRNDGATNSVHSWGMCLDFNAVQNPNGSMPSTGGRYVLGSDIMNVVRRMGGLHGREWAGSTPDCMHIECKLDPGEVAQFDRDHPPHGAHAQPSKATAVPPPTATRRHTPFPLAAGCYFGPLSGPAESISGQGGDDARYRPYLAIAQHRLGVAADGLYGVATAHAVTRYQTRHGLAVDGDLGPKTWAVLVP